MDSLIIDSTPKGSAILAYGAARGPRWNGRLLALIAGSLAFVILGIAAWLLLIRVPLPADRLITAVVQPHALHDRLDPSLRQDFPASWRAALETKSRIPAALGISLGKDQRMHAFAVVARTAVVSSVPGLVVTSHGPVHLLTDGSDGEMEKTPLRNLLGIARDVSGRDAAFRIRGDLLARLASDTSEAVVSEIHGEWSGGTGRLRLSPEQLSVPVPTEGMGLFALIGGDAHTTPIVNGLLQQGVDLRGWSTLPEAIALRPGTDGGIFLSWNQPLALPDARLLAAERGLGEIVPFVLPDATSINEQWPGSASTTESVLETWLPFTDTPLFASSSSTNTNPCPGIIRFSLQGEALRQTLTGWQIPDSWKTRVFAFRISETPTDVRVCLN
jgi:hypothetical protein